MDTPSSAAASAALIPGLAWKYGTMFSSRARRVDSRVVAAALPFRSFAPSDARAPSVTLSARRFPLMR
ncbi:hypothetical protein [Nocardia seriolae]|uniref:hypothetical protein n=1 Tax=Nocardia seriolae TaxID=37332 RepID=UPI001E472F27|nr:hypothetical protein [Nocardia seriolae]